MQSAFQRNEVSQNSNEVQGKERYMGLRDNICYKRRELRKQLTPNENYCLDEIQLGSILLNFSSKAEFDLRDLAENTQIELNKLYVVLKQLESKKLIIRKKTRYTHLEIIGLNPEVFGQLLINKLHEEEKRKLKLVVNNSNSRQETSVPNRDLETPQSGVTESQTGTEPLPIRDKKPLQDIEIIKEKPPLDLYRTNKSLRREDMNVWIKEEDKKTQQDGWPTSEQVKKGFDHIYNVIGMKR